jgi:hypothetical protein
MKMTITIAIAVAIYPVTNNLTTFMHYNYVNAQTIHRVILTKTEKIQVIYTSTKKLIVGGQIR